MQRITSRQNPRLRAAERLLTSARDRRKARRCVLEGEHLVGVYAARRGPPETLIVAEDFLARPSALALAERHADRTLIVPAKLFAELAVLPAGVGMIAVVPVPPQPSAATERPGAPGVDFCVLLDDLQDRQPAAVCAGELVSTVGEPPHPRGPARRGKGHGGEAEGGEDQELPLPALFRFQRFRRHRETGRLRRGDRQGPGRDEGGRNAVSLPLTISRRSGGDS